MTGRVSGPLDSANENLLENSFIPEYPLTQVPERTLVRIGKVEHSLRLKIKKHLNQEIKYTESDLSSFLRKPRSSQKTTDELIEKAKSTKAKMPDEDKIEKFKNLFVENIQLQKNYSIKRKLSKYKFELEKIDQNE